MDGFCNGKAFGVFVIGAEIDDEGFRTFCCLVCCDGVEEGGSPCGIKNAGTVDVTKGEVVGINSGTGECLVKASAGCYSRCGDVGTNGR